MAHLYYDESLQATEIVELLQRGAKQPIQHTIQGAEARHAVNVARLKKGERILVADGHSLRCEAVVESVVAGKDPSFTVRILDCAVVAADKPEIIIVQALAKGDRAERAVEICTELGADVFIPWQAARSVSLWQTQEKIARSVQKWQRVAIAAAKQSLRTRVPVVHTLHTTKMLCELNLDDCAVIILHPWQHTKLTEVLDSLAKDLKDIEKIYFVVGPEGGLTEEEITQFVAAGAKTAVLGQNVLRTSTAAAAAVAVLQTFLARW